MRTMRSLRALLADAIVCAFQQAAFAQGGPADLTLDSAARAAVIEGAIKNLNSYYVFPETAKKMEQAIHERMQKKEYDQITSAITLASTLTGHLQEVSHDKHLRVR